MLRKTVALAAAAGSLVLCVNAANADTITLPPAHGQFDYQIGGAYTPDSSVAIVDRDFSAAPVAGKYNICYINALQSQADSGSGGGEPEYDTVSWWVKYHNDLIVKDSKGKPVLDPDWHEAVLDVSTTAKQQAILDIEKPWIDGCKTSGFQAIEPDNLDSYSRSKGAFTFAKDKEYMKAFVTYAHGKGLAVAQKNTNSEFGTSGRTEVGFNFAIAEECGFYGECGEYAAAYGNNYFEIEYTDENAAKFRAACRDHGATVSIIRRDRDVVPRGTSGYHYELCP
ncbi:endo alpha-1,4 polygalactosaminidase [Actinocrispum wychmicini]|uniref:Glycosyl hydrolase family 114 n=1 Tax=Actinocrispum wychmicini TaxID=1213861 RepID=A0A4R2J6Z3_9PSEU|nr:endo alpha-1,4 polygalactosaminidase [Actinocrispum wychmicini]TCO54833.1 glycosyl hydrolase family 114 [Actinocrispum wychmicini]